MLEKGKSFVTCCVDICSITINTMTSKLITVYNMHHFNIAVYFYMNDERFVFR